MEPIGMIVAAGAYVAAVVAKKYANPAIEKACDHIVSLFKSQLGEEPHPADYDPVVIRQAGLEKNQALGEEVGRVFAESSALRRGRLVEQVLRGAQVLWVDDHPKNNEYERRTLNAFGIQINCVRTTEEALSKVGRTSYDLILSDMERDGRSDAGLQLLDALRRRRQPIPVVFYVGRASPGTPAGAFAIIDQPEPLLHYVFDVLERQRV